MTFWQVFLMLATMIVLWLLASFLERSARSDHEAAMTGLIARLLEENKALMEALARKNNQPLIFTKQPTRTDPGWWSEQAKERETITADGK